MEVCIGAVPNAEIAVVVLAVDGVAGEAGEAGEGAPIIAATAAEVEAVDTTDAAVDVVGDAVPAAALLVVRLVQNGCARIC